MKKTMRKIAAIGAVALGAFMLTGCTTPADTTNHNLDLEAESFNLVRDIKFINGITDNILLEVRGHCSVDTGDSDLGQSLQVTCKVSTDSGPVYVKHFLILSDNVTATIEQILPTKVDAYHYKFQVRPESIVPDIDIDTQIEDELRGDAPVDKF